CPLRPRPRPGGAAPPDQRDCAGRRLAGGYRGVPGAARRPLRADRGVAARRGLKSTSTIGAWLRHAGVSQGPSYPGPGRGATDDRRRGFQPTEEATVRFGLILTNQHPPGQPYLERFHDTIEQVRAARELGFDLITFGQHFLLNEFQAMQP